MFDAISPVKPLMEKLENEIDQCQQQIAINYSTMKYMESIDAATSELLSKQNTELTKRSEIANKKIKALNAIAQDLESDTKKKLRRVIGASDCTEQHATGDLLTEWQTKADQDPSGEIKVYIQRAIDFIANIDQSQELLKQYIEHSELSTRDKDTITKSLVCPVFAKLSVAGVIKYQSAMAAAHIDGTVRTMCDTKHKTQLQKLQQHSYCYYLFEKQLKSAIKEVSRTDASSLTMELGKMYWKLHIEPKFLEIEREAEEREAAKSEAAIESCPGEEDDTFVDALSEQDWAPQQKQKQSKPLPFILARFLLFIAALIHLFKKSLPSTKSFVVTSCIGGYTSPTRNNSE